MSGGASRRGSPDVAGAAVIAVALMVGLLGLVGSREHVPIGIEGVRALEAATWLFLAAGTRQSFGRIARDVWAAPTFERRVEEALGPEALFTLALLALVVALLFVQRGLH